jgi:transcriptional regulator of acetoin/glycerol metabolism
MNAKDNTSLNPSFQERSLNSVTATEEETGLFGVDRPGVAWDWMKQSQQVPDGLDWVRPQVAEAWQRCLYDYGLEPGKSLLKNTTQKVPAKDLPNSGTDIFDDIKESLLGLTYNLYSYLLETGVTLLVADASGKLIHVMDSGLHQCPLGRDLVKLGVNWNESILGNSGLGTAAVLKEAVAFDGKEHFYSSLHPFATAGYPIFTIDGKLMATIGVVTDRRDSAQSLLAFLRLAGYLIEQNLFKRHSPWEFLIRVRPANPSDSLGVKEALFDGLLSVDSLGVIHGANRTAHKLLGYDSHKELLLQNISQILGVGLDEMIERLSNGSVGALKVKSKHGINLMVEAGVMPHNTSHFQLQIQQTSMLPELLPTSDLESLDHAEKITPSKLLLPSTRVRRQDHQWKDAVLETALQQAIGFQERKIQILITGESGVGKDHLVRSMHSAGSRKDQPLVAINCASIPRDLIESELFGYEPGSFTGANSKGKPGKFLLADNGILFLDEIGDMALDLQATLLRVLDSSEFVPIGGKMPIKVNVHVVAATHCRLQDKVRDGTFRRDLYYRLNGAQVWLPPLRERPDKMRLIESLLKKESQSLDIKEYKQISDEVWDIFLKHPWPGNIRELANLLRSCIAMSTGPLITIKDLPWYFLDEYKFDQAPESDGNLGFHTEINQTLSLAEPVIKKGALVNFEIKGIKEALALSGGNISEASRILGVTRVTLYSKMNRYEIKP